jgi:hypothetical protein
MMAADDPKWPLVPAFRGLPGVHRACAVHGGGSLTAPTSPQRGCGHPRQTTAVSSDERNQAFLRAWGLMAIDGFELDVPGTPANAAAFGNPAGSREHPAFPKVRVVSIGGCGSHAKVAAQMGPLAGSAAASRPWPAACYPAGGLAADRRPRVL